MRTDVVIEVLEVGRLSPADVLGATSSGVDLAAPDRPVPELATVGAGHNREATAPGQR